jgi:hypothetical protein
MWIETDHHGLINLDHVKRIDLAGDIEKRTYGVYLFDVNDNTFPVLDLPRFESIGILKGGETEREIHVAMYTLYTLTRKLIAGLREGEIVTIETIYRELATAWYKEKKKEQSAAQEAEAAVAGDSEPIPEEQTHASTEPASGKRAKVHQFTDMKQFLDAYSTGYLQKIGTKPVINYKGEGKIASQLLKLYPLEKLKTMLAWYFDSKEEFIVKAVYDMKTFRAIIERAKKTGSSDD